MAIPLFKGAWGSVGPDSTYRESLDPTILWISIPTSLERMTALWKESGISMGPTSAYSEMLASTNQRLITCTFFKVALGWFKGSMWLGNVSLDFQSRNIYVGSVSGRTQLDMWQHLKQYVDGTASLQESSDRAITAASG
jgi:hypothetical protein